MNALWLLDGEQTNPWCFKISDWKQELRTEILNEVKEQMTAMTKTILDELRDSHRPTQADPHPRATSGPTNLIDPKPHPAMLDINGILNAN